MKSEIKLYNTLSRKTEVFSPIDPDGVRMYTCGPTVYNFAHIGNLRTYIVEDVIRRTFAFAGYSVIHAMNITDVGHLVGDEDGGDDKVDVEARKSGAHPLDIAKKFESQFFADLTDLNCLAPTKVVRATDAIASQIELIKELERKGFAYVTQSAVYFDTSKLADYGKLTGQNLEEKEAGAREEVVVDPEKRNPADFALWFFLVGRYAEHILQWDSPWGKGFPGWHVECSAIARDILGQPFDIHMGGVDHIGTHHTNEIAQSEAAYDAPLANYWLHAEHLLVDDRKMSKSLGNVYTLKDITDKGYEPADFRYLVLMAHYRSRMNFTWEALESARRTRLGVVRFLEESQGNNELSSETKASLLAALANDFDTPKLLAMLHENKNVMAWRTFDDVLGLGVAVLAPRVIKLNVEDSISPSDNMTVRTTHQGKIGDEVLLLVQKREQARRQKDWQTADKLRDHVLEAGFVIEDTPTGPRLDPK